MTYKGKVHASQTSRNFGCWGNGVGKTTTIGKLAHLYHTDGQKVLLGAADTFRAAAVDQLTMWSEKVGVPIVKQQMGSDPASVAYDAVTSGLLKVSIM